MGRTNRRNRVDNNMKMTSIEIIILDDEAFAKRNPDLCVLSTFTVMQLFIMAHERDMKFNDFVVQILKEYINENDENSRKEKSNSRSV